MIKNITRKFVLLIVCFIFIFIFINKAQAEEKILKYADFSKNEIMLSEENYLVVGNVGNDFNSIKYFADKYCSNKLGGKYISSSIQISTNVAFAYCNKIDELDQYNLTDAERSCFHKFDQFIEMYQRDCKNIGKDFKSILAEVKEYREQINILGSDTFIYEILNEDISKKILNFEAKNFLPLVKNNINIKDLNLLDAIIINRNKNLCKSYGFVEGSALYFSCILPLMKNHNFITNGLIDY